jgi:tRNA(fMet)-specific endonuclease VapC
VLVAAQRQRHPLERAIADDDDVAIAAVTVAELLVGVELATARRRTRREVYVADLLEAIAVENYTIATARAHARLLAATRKTGRPRGAHDVIIAATAAASDRIVLTTDAAGFVDLPGVEVRLLGT